MPNRRFHQILVASIAAVSAVSTGFAMCVATTQSLLEVEIHACQAIRMGASSAKPDSHPLHEKGSSITGVLVTGRVVESEKVWDRESDDRRFLMEVRSPDRGEIHSFFMAGSARQLCDGLIGTVTTLVTVRPCCDVLPAQGLCLVPAPLTIVQVEKSPERWERWMPADQE